MIENNTEEKILEAARQVFLEKGFDGARMQEIADKAEINKAMLHYYFRKKDKLFEKVFEDAFKKFIPQVGQIMLSDDDLIIKIKSFISTYIDLLMQNQFLPLFIMKEITRNPKIIENLITIKFSEVLEAFQYFIDDEVANGKIKSIDAKNLIINIVSMCIFPFIAQPMMLTFFEMKTEEYNKLMIDRKEVVFEVISLWLKP